MTFIGSDLRNADGVDTFSWTFGDGASKSGATVSHTFAAQADPYVVVLTVSNAAGSDTAQVTVRVPC